MATINLVAPQANTEINFPVAEGITEYVFDFDIANAIIERVEKSLVISFDEIGSSITLENFYDVYSSDFMPEFVLDGELIAGEDFFAAISPDLMPAAGNTDANPQLENTGSGVETVSQQTIADGVTALGGIEGESSFGVEPQLSQGTSAPDSSTQATAPENIPPAPTTSETPESPNTENTAPVTPQTPDSENTTPETPQTPDTENTTPETPQTPDTENTTPETPQTPDSENTTPETPDTSLEDTNTGTDVDTSGVLQSTSWQDSSFSIMDTSPSDLGVTGFRVNGTTTLKSDEVELNGFTISQGSIDQETGLVTENQQNFSNIVVKNMDGETGISVANTTIGETTGDCAMIIDLPEGEGVAYSVSLELAHFYAEGKYDGKWDWNETSSETVTVQFYKDGELVYEETIISTRESTDINHESYDQSFDFFIGGGFDRVVLSAPDTGTSNINDFALKSMDFGDVSDEGALLSVEGNIEEASGLDGTFSIESISGMSDGETLSINGEDVTLTWESDSFVTATDADGAPVFSIVLNSQSGEYTMHQYQSFEDSLELEFTDDEGDLYDSQVEGRLVSTEGDNASNIIAGSDEGDTMEGLDGDDLLLANEGDDTMLGGAGDDVMHGGDGDDIMHGGEGSDIMTGGEGADVYSWLSDSFTDGANDIITDFGEGDILDISSFTSDNDFIVDHETVGDDTVFTITKGEESQTITLQDADFDVNEDMAPIDDGNAMV